MKAVVRLQLYDWQSEYCMVASYNSASVDALFRIRNLRFLITHRASPVSLLHTQHVTVSPYIRFT